MDGATVRNCTIFVVLMLLILSGCGLKKDYIEVSYAPASNVAKIQDAGSVKLKGEALDRRANKENVGRKGSEYSFLGPLSPRVI
jgi:hypothetical protein